MTEVFNPSSQSELAVSGESSQRFWEADSESASPERNTKKQNSEYINLNVV